MFFPADTSCNDSSGNLIIACKLFQFSYIAAIQQLILFLLPNFVWNERFLC